MCDSELVLRKTSLEGRRGTRSVGLNGCALVLDEDSVGKWFAEPSDDVRPATSRRSRSSLDYQRTPPEVRRTLVRLMGMHLALAPPTVGHHVSTTRLAMQRLMGVSRSVPIAALTIGLTSCAGLGLRSVRGPYVSHANARADIQAALLEAQADHKFVLLDFGANWCPPCHELRSLFDTPHAASYLQANFHLVYIDVGRFDRNGDVVRKYGFVTSQGIPALTVLASSGEVIAVARGKALDPVSSGDDIVRFLSARIDRTSSGASALPRPPVQLDPAQIRTSAETLRVRTPGESVGTFVLKLEVSGDSVTSAIVSSWHDTLVQHVLTVHDGLSLRPKEVWDSTGAEQVHLIYAAGRVRGTRVTPNPHGPPDTVNFDLPTDPGAVDRSNVPLIVSRLALVPSTTAVVPVFDSWTLRTYPVQLVVGDRTGVALPAGTVDAYRIDVTGELWNLPQTWYRSADPPHRILRSEWPRHAVLELAR